MFKLLCLIVILGVTFSAKPEYGSEHCTHILQMNCTGFSDEPVCGFDGHTHVTYLNSCEFAKGICSHHGHSMHAISEGPCNAITTP